MRTKPRVGEKLWFGPRLLGWGWTPLSWEGWAVSVVGIVLLIVVRARFDSGTGDTLVAVILLALVGIGIAKGTDPGGPMARREFRRTKEPAADTEWTLDPGRPRKVL